MDYHEKLRRDSFQRHLLEKGDTEQLHKAATMLNEARGSSAEAESYTALQWREEPPTKPGWYWYAKSKTKVTIRYIFRSRHGGLEVKICDGKNLHPSDLHGKWKGPIPKPCTPEAEGAV